MKKTALGIAIAGICVLNISASDIGLDNVVLTDTSTNKIEIKDIPQCPNTMLVDYEPNTNNTKDTFVVRKQQEICVDGDSIIYNSTSNALNVGKKVTKEEYEKYVNSYAYSVIKNISKEYKNDITKVSGMNKIPDELNSYTLEITIDKHSNRTIAYIKKQKDKDDEYYISLHKYIRNSLEHK